jgi:hypothetical protein
MRRSESSGTLKALRPRADINHKLDKKLVGYATAAAAAGVAVLAGAAPAAAEVVYTPANVNLRNGPYGLDLNHDGTVDYTLQFCGEDVCGSSHEAGFELLLGKGNLILSNGKALSHGAPIGPGDKFTSNTSYGGVILAVAGQYGSKSWFFGEWAPGINKYLGFKFLVDGEVHYGWARLKVTDWFKPNGVVQLEGYAYETIARKGLPAGLVQQSEALPAMGTEMLTAYAAPAANLGMLAAGSAGLEMWRREE